MALDVSLSFSDGINSHKYSHRRSLSDVEVICLDAKDLPDIPPMLTGSIYKVLNLPLRRYVYDLLTISFVVSVQNTATGEIYGTSFDPYITFPPSQGSVLLDDFLFHPINPDGQNMMSFV